MCLHQRPCVAFAQGEPNIFLKKGGEPLDPVPCRVKGDLPLIHVSGRPAPCQGRHPGHCYRPCDFVCNVMRPFLSQIGGSASTLLRDRGCHGFICFPFSFPIRTPRLGCARPPPSGWFVRLSGASAGPHAALSRAACSGQRFCSDFARMATLRLFSGGSVRCWRCRSVCAALPGVWSACIRAAALRRLPGPLSGSTEAPTHQKRVLYGSLGPRSSIKGSAGLGSL